MGSTKKDKVKLFMHLRSQFGLIGLVVVALGWTSSSIGQTSQHAPDPGPGHPAVGLADEQPPIAMFGAISGTVVDQSGALIPGARVALTREGWSGEDRSNEDHSYKQEHSNKQTLQLQEVVTGDD